MPISLPVSDFAQQAALDEYVARASILVLIEKISSVMSEFGIRKHYAQPTIESSTVQTEFRVFVGFVVRFTTNDGATFGEGNNLGGMEVVVRVLHLPARTEIFHSKTVPKFVVEDFAPIVDSTLKPAAK